jgi:hypothetical protein
MVYVVGQQVAVTVVAVCRSAVPPWAEVRKGDGPVRRVSLKHVAATGGEVELQVALNAADQKEA